MSGLRQPLRLLLLVLAAAVMVALGARGVLAPPDLLLVVVVAAALVGGRLAGAGTGVAAGWLLDLLPPGGAPLGLTALLWAGVGALAGTARRRGGHPWWWPPVVTLAAFVGTRLVPTVLSLASGRPVDALALGWQLVTTVTLAAALVPMLTRLDGALVRRRWA